MSTIDQARTLVLQQYSAEQAAEGFAYAEQHEATGAEEFLSLALAKILYSADELAQGARYPVAAGSIEDYFA